MIFNCGEAMEIDELYGMADCTPADIELLQTYDDYPVISMMQIVDLGFRASDLCGVSDGAISAA